MNWDALLIAGKESYREEDWLKAEFFTQKAEELLIQDLKASGIKENVLLAWICANHNLAAIFEQQGDSRVALQYLIQAHQFVLSLFEDATDAKITVLALNALDITLKRLNTFREQYPICDICYNALADHESLQYRQQVISALH